MSKKEFVKNMKLFLIAFACCIPLFVVMGIFCRDALGGFWIVTIYVVIGAGAFVLALHIDKKRQEKLALKREKSRLRKRFAVIENAQNKDNKDNKDKKRK